MQKCEMQCLEAAKALLEIRKTQTTLVSIQKELADIRSMQTEHDKQMYRLHANFYQQSKASFENMKNLLQQDKK